MYLSAILLFLISTIPLMRMIAFDIKRLSCRAFAPLSSHAYYSYYFPSRADARLPMADGKFTAGRLIIPFTAQKSFLMKGFS